MQKSQAALNLAANVRALMKRDGLSQEELARLSGVSKSAIGYLLNYKDSSSRHAGIDTIEGLARVFKLSPGALVDESFTDVRARELQEVRLPSQEGMMAPESVKSLAEAIGLFETLLKRTKRQRPPLPLQAEMIAAAYTGFRLGEALAVIRRDVLARLEKFGEGPVGPQGTAGGRRRGTGSAPT